MTAQERYAANMALIAAYNEEFAKQIDAVIITNMQFVQAASGATVGVAWDVVGQRWVALQSLEDPEADARRDVDALWTRDAKVFSLLGIGCGYFAVEFARRLEPHQRLGLFEVSPTMFKVALHCTDCSPLLGGKRIDTCIGDALEGSMQHWWLSLQSQEKMHIASPMRAGYTSVIDKERYDALQLKSMDYLRYHAVGLATWAQFGYCIGDNDLENLPEYMITPGVQELKGRWHGKPAVCVAAGPSLEKNLRWLMDPEIRRHVAVIAVGTVYALLHGWGVVPDVVTSIDFQRLNWTDQFRNVPQDERTSLVYLHSVYPQIPRRWPGPRFVARNSSDTVSWMAAFAEEKADASQVQTVAHLNLCVAQILEADPIILLGQDLSAPLDQHHATGARAQDTAPGEHLAAHVNAEDIYGQSVWTRHSFLSMRSVFTHLMQGHPGPRYWNCTEGGLHIDGAEDMPLAVALDQMRHTWCVPDQPLYDVLRDVHAQYVPQTKWEELDAGVRGLIDHVDLLNVTARRAGELERAYGDGQKGWPRSKDSMAPADQACGEIPYSPGSTYRADMRRRILELEAVLGMHGTAFALFCVRRFDLVTKLSDIPPKMDELDRDGMDEANAQRILTAYRCIREEGPVVRQRLRMMQRRLQDVMPGVEKTFNWPMMYHLVARQHYSLVVNHLRRWLSTLNGGGLPGLAAGEFSRGFQMYMRVLQARGQYEDVLALARMIQRNDRRRRRCETLLDRYRREVVPIAATYVRGAASTAAVTVGEAVNGGMSDGSVVVDTTAADERPGFGGLEERMVACGESSNESTGREESRGWPSPIRLVPPHR